MIDRALAGFLLAGALALGARAVRSLSRGGAVAALLVGTAAAMAGWPWAFVLITFFLTSSGLSRFRRTAREALIAGIVEKSDERDAIQVLANGGLFAAMALASTLTGQPLLATAALGALAAAAADTWATEVGTLAGGVPRRSSRQGGHGRHCARHRQFKPDPLGRRQVEQADRASGRQTPPPVDRSATHARLPQV